MCVFDVYARRVHGDWCNLYLFTWGVDLVSDLHIDLRPSHLYSAAVGGESDRNVHVGGNDRVCYHHSVVETGGE